MLQTREPERVTLHLVLSLNNTTTDNSIIWTYNKVKILSYLLNCSVTDKRDKEVKEGCISTDLLPYEDSCFAL